MKIYDSLVIILLLILSLLFGYHTENFLRERSPFPVAPSSACACVIVVAMLVVVALPLQSVLGNEYLQVLLSPS